MVKKQITSWQKKMKDVGKKRNDPTLNPEPWTLNTIF